MKKFVRTALAMAIIGFAVLAFVSCQSKEERAISKLESIVERVEKDGKDFSAEEWDEVYQELDELDDDCSECEFDKKQKKQIRKAEGRLAVAIAKNGGKAIGRGIINALGAGASMFGDILDGVSEGLDDNSGEIDDVFNKISEGLGDIKDELDE